MRVIRACTDAGLTSVAVYAEPDRDALHVRMADEAFALGGTTPGDSYLVIDKVIDAAKRSGADAVHPGYGFLSENADFAQAVIDAGLTWIGPSPESIRDLGDKVVARHIASGRRAARRRHQGPGDGRRRGGRVRRGARPADRHQGGVRRRRARHEDRPRDGGDRRAVRVRGARGGVGVRPRRVLRRALPRPAAARRGAGARRHSTATSIVVGTRDCSLQRRNQKLVEEAPAPFLTDEQRERIHASAKAICREADYYGAGTVEYLVGVDGVDQLPRGEHPAAGRAPGHRGDQRHRPRARAVPDRRRRARCASTEDPAPRGHAIEFRINGEDPAATSCPRPARSPAARAGRAPACASTPASSRRGESAARSTRCWPS